MQALNASAAVRPGDLIGPTHRPTCRSGSPPRDAFYPSAVAVQG